MRRHPTFTQYVKLAHGDFNHDGNVDIAGAMWAPAGHGVQIAILLSDR